MEWVVIALSLILIYWVGYRFGYKDGQQVQFYKDEVTVEYPDQSKLHVYVTESQSQARNAMDFIEHDLTINNPEPTDNA